MRECLGVYKSSSLQILTPKIETARCFFRQEKVYFLWSRISTVVVHICVAKSSANSSLALLLGSLQAATPWLHLSKRMQKHKNIRSLSLSSVSVLWPSPLANTVASQLILENRALSKHYRGQKKPCLKKNSWKTVWAGCACGTAFSLVCNR